MTASSPIVQTLISPHDVIGVVNTLLSQQATPANIALYGPLGTGKTTFTQQFGQHLGCSEPIVSPTFTLLNEYPLPNNQILVHADVYRLFEDASPDLTKLIPLLEQLNEWLHNPQAWVLVEWANLLNDWDERYATEWDWELALEHHLDSTIGTDLRVATLRKTS